MSHFIKDGLDLVEKSLGADGLGVALFEVDALVVERLEVILLILLTPHFVEPSLSLSPLFLFCF